MKKNIFFLSGLPRSGSTVLAAILNQHPELLVSTTSGLADTLGEIVTSWQKNSLLHNNDADKIKLKQVMRGVIDSFYEDIEKPIVLDKNRIWPEPNIMKIMEQVLGQAPKIIATVRSVPECMASFVRVAKPSDLQDFLNSSSLSEHLKTSYVMLQDGYQAAPDNFLFVEYNNLLSNPNHEIDRIHSFLGLSDFEYDLNNIDPTIVKENDEEIHGYSGLHDIKPKLEKQHNQTARDVLGYHYNQFCQPEFWTDEATRTKYELDDLDAQVIQGRLGNFAEGWEIAERLNRERPESHRAAYNRSWYLLRQGKILDGYKEMNRGRYCGAIGKKRPDTPAPEWDGKSRGTILLYCDHGLGDQIHQVRYAKDLVRMGCKVVVCCSGQLVQLFSTIPEVSAVVQHGAEYGVYHDYWAFAMVAPLYLGYELKDLSGAPYIEKPITITGKKKRIGLRWQGSSKFEDDHQKQFPYNLFFDAIQDFSEYEFISLQRDEGSDACPPWVKRVPLDTWIDTQNAIASCDLVISSCTSVSHLAAAMGVETWVIIPVMGYYLYAMDGEKTPYYDSMTLFRQEIFGNWEAPFEQVKLKLSSQQPKLRMVS